MQWKGFVGGFALATVLVGGGLLTAWKRTDAQPLRWANKIFYDDGDTRPDSGQIIASGALYGEDMNGSTYVNVECYRPDKVCRVADIAAMGDEHWLSWINTATFDIKQWDDETVVAENTPMAGTCNRVKIVFYRASKTAQYIRIPVANRNAERCKALSPKVFTWDIGKDPA